MPYFEVAEGAGLAEGFTVGGGGGFRTATADVGGGAEGDAGGIEITLALAEGEPFGPTRGSASTEMVGGVVFEGALAGRDAIGAVTVGLTGSTTTAGRVGWLLAMR